MGIWFGIRMVILSTTQSFGGDHGWGAVSEPHSGAAVRQSALRDRTQGEGKGRLTRLNQIVPDNRDR